ncbi:hypothetical protein [Carboxylicivirga sp. M1479]|uniref:hypothetical protein n=1 Tax=Carboxylicivirga sp. M1479 TaxID=2594476 RepID=UPI001178900B|nr:hypothetical protein [Carboxylicivirga sp. M1479]TRX70899.1 hypothetical protein FNN09_09560 [Carboxylicivirga sp. M1479]
MDTKFNYTEKKKYYEDQLVFILMSYHFRVDRIKKIIRQPIFEAPSHIHRVKVELAEIFRRLKTNGWNIQNIQL